MTTFYGINFEGLVPETADCLSVDISAVQRDTPLTLRITRGGLDYDLEVVVPQAAQTAVAWYAEGEPTALRSCCMKDYSADSGELAVAWV